jgi:hypothetical protein
MHTFLTLTSVDGLWYVEREVSGLISALRGHCDSIHSCDISVKGPAGVGGARCWQVELRIRVFGEIVRITIQAPEGTDPQQALARLLADICTQAMKQLTHISAQHDNCCALCA